MGYLGDRYDHDLFVSYSHADPDGTGDSELKYWSRELVTKLVRSIRQRSTEFRKLKVSIDTDLDPSRPLRDQLHDRVSRSALFLLVMSPLYLDSKWCGQELNWFRSIARNVRHNGYILVVRALWTEEKRWPDVLKDAHGNPVLGFHFHKQPGNENTDPFGYPEPLPRDREFYSQLATLRSTVMERLREIKNRPTLAAEPISHGLSEQVPTVFLDAKPQQADQWQYARQKLLDGGFRVLPERPPLEIRHIGHLRAAKRRRIEDIDRSEAVLVLAGEDLQKRLNAAVDDARHVNRQRKPTVGILKVNGTSVDIADQTIVNLSHHEWLFAMEELLQTELLVA